MAHAAQPETNLDLAERFLLWAHPRGPWVLTAIPPEGGRTTTETFHDVKAARGWIGQRSGKQNIYWTVNRVRGSVEKKPKKEDIEEAVALHVDLDPRKPRDGMTAEELDRWNSDERERILKQLNDFSPSPSAVIYSGGGYQAFWQLDEPLYIGGDPNRISELEAYNKQLGIVLGGDNTFNIDRIMRLPGTINLPDEKKRKKGRREVMADIVELSEVKHPLEDFTPAVEVQSSSGGSGVKVQISGNLPRLTDLDELPEAVTPRTRMLIVQGDDPDDPTKYGSRSEIVWAVLCEMIRAGCSDDQIAAVMLDPDFGISAHCLAQKRSVEYVARQIERAREEVIDSWPMRSVDEAVDWINRRYFAALEGKRVTFYREQADKLFPMDKEAFFFELAGKDVIVGPPNKEQRLPAAQLWGRDPRRRYYPEGLLLDPGRPNDGRAYNLWRGFGVEPAPGDWALMEAHISDILANGNPEHASYITRFAAWCFQNPATPPRAALVFQGGEGVGKGVFAQALMEAFGHHGLHVRSMSQVTGRFNSHLRHCCLLYADEAEATNAREEGALKGLITERTIACEGKGKDLIQVDNHVHLVMASNENWVVPAGKDSRRFAVFRVSAARQRDKAYFDALVAQMRNGGLAAMIHDMLAMDLSGFHPEHDRPETDALAEQRAASLRGFERVWFDVLRSGDMPPLYSSKRVGTDRVFASTTEFRDFAMQKLRREDLTVSEVGGLFARMGFEKIDSGRPRGWIVPPLAEARRRWDETNFAMPWDGTATWAIEEYGDGTDGSY